MEKDIVLVANVGSVLVVDNCIISEVNTQQAKHQIWFILLTIGKKSFVTLIFSPGLGTCNYCPNMKYGVHRTGGAKVPHN